MQIIIKNLSTEKFVEINEEFGCGRWYLFKEFNDDPEELTIDVCLDDDVVIFKVVSDYIQLDLGGHKVDVDPCDFRKVEIV